jgi:hypothetical protein
LSGYPVLGEELLRLVFVEIQLVRSRPIS